MNISSGQENGILHNTIADLKERVGNHLDNLCIERIVIGLFFTGVKLTNGHAGLCFTPIKTIPEAVCCPSSAKAMPNSGKIKGTPVVKILDGMFYGNSLKRAIGISTMNALSNTVWEERGFERCHLQKNADPLEGYLFPKKSTTVVVGALVPYLRMLKSQGNDYFVLEKDTATLKPDELKHYVPEDQAYEKIHMADTLIVTGTTLINGTLDGILSASKPGANVIVVGPTASMIPDAFFERGVTSIGGVMVTQPDSLLDILAEAGSGYHFFEKSADRIVLTTA